METQRILRGAPALVGVTFADQEGEPRPVTDVTVDVHRADGSLLKQVSSLSSDSDDVVQVPLTAIETSLLDILTLTATANGAVAESTVLIVGGFLFSLREALEVETSIKASTPAETLQRVRLEVLLEAQLICRRLLVPTPRLVTMESSACGSLNYGVPDFIRFVKYRLVEGSNDDWLDGAPVRSDRDDFRYQVLYEAGMLTVPDDLKRAAISRFRNRLNNGLSGMDERMTSYSNGDGTYSLATPGINGFETGLPEVDAVYKRYRWARPSAMSVVVL